jgi:hypothetical protein
LGERAEEPIAAGHRGLLYSAICPLHIHISSCICRRRRHHA